MKNNKINNLLVCLDLTKTDNTLIKYASFLSEKISVDKIIFIHVIQSYNLPENPSKQKEDTDNKLSKTIKDEINSVISNYFKTRIKTEVVTKVEDVDASDVIINFIEKENIDLTITGQKYGLDREAHYGQKITQKSASDIMFIPEDAELSVSNILCAIDLSADSEKAFSKAKYISELTDSKIVCHYIYDFSKAYFPGSTIKTSSSIEKRFNKKYRKFLKKFKLDNSSVKFRYNQENNLGNQAEMIIETAREENSDLIILGSKGKVSNVTTLLGNITENIRKAENEIPALIIKNKVKKKWFDL